MDEFETWWESPSGAYGRQHKFLAKAAWEAGREAGMREAANEVPSNWCDQFLTGPNGIGKPPWDCRHITNLLNNLRRNILAAIGEGK